MSGSEQVQEEDEAENAQEMIEDEPLCLLCFNKYEERSGEGLTYGMCDCRGFNHDRLHYYCLADRIVEQFDKPCPRCGKLFKDRRIRRKPANIGPSERTVAETLFVWVVICLYGFYWSYRYAMSTTEYVVFIIINVVMFVMTAILTAQINYVNQTILEVYNEDDLLDLAIVHPHLAPPEKAEVFKIPHKVSGLGEPIDKYGNPIPYERPEVPPNVQWIGGKGGHEADYGVGYDPEWNVEWFDAYPGEELDIDSNSDLYGSDSDE